VDPFFHLVERRLEEAERAGVFRDLPGSGAPLRLDDLSAVPAELRASFLLLRGAGFVPPELEARKEWLRLEHLLAACADDGERTTLRDASRSARTRYLSLLEQRGASQGWLDYRTELLARLADG
jgi:hypothetical protein